MSENEIPNYFVLNKYSKLWETDDSFGDKDYVSLTPNSSFVLSSITDIPLRLYFFDNDSTRAEPTPMDPNSFSFDLDRYNMLYLLEKDTKKIRRLSVDRYEQYGTTNTDNLIFDEYIIACKGLKDPQSVATTDRHIYVLDNSTLYVLSKIDYNLTKTLMFHNRIHLFKPTEDEGILFYSYVNDESVICRKDLIQGFKTSEGDREEDQRIKITQNSTSSYNTYTDNEVF